MNGSTSVAGYRTLRGSRTTERSRRYDWRAVRRNSNSSVLCRRADRWTV